MQNTIKRSNHVGFMWIDSITCTTPSPSLLEHNQKQKHSETQFDKTRTKPKVVVRPKFGPKWPKSSEILKWLRSMFELRVQVGDVIIGFRFDGLTFFHRS